jgi:diphosphomevalonate decarboxylase
MKSTAVAPSNIAFVKYWGKKDERLRLPANGSISMNLDNLLTTTTVEFIADLSADDVTVNGEQLANEAERVSRHLDRIREVAGIGTRARVVSRNNFPTGTGLSSSASGFAALSVAGAAAAGLALSESALSILARQGSGSACRSIPDGITEWRDGATSADSYAVSLYPPDYWAIADVVAVISDSRKEIGTTEGHDRAESSPFYTTRLGHMPQVIADVKAALADRDFARFGELVEAEALELHAIMLTSRPSLIYWRPATLVVMKAVQAWRRAGLPVYFTVNTGQDIHLICPQEHVETLQERLAELPEVRQTIVNRPAPGTRLSEEHLF